MSIFFEPEGDAAQEGPSRPAGPRWRRYLLRAAVVAGVLVVVVGAIAGLYVGSVSKSFTSNLHRDALLPSDSGLGTVAADAPARPKKADTKAVDFVLMGSDSRDPDAPGAGRSDTLMVMHLAADRKSAYLVSFPRDMYVPIPRHGKNKINAAYSFGGVPLAVETLEQLLDTRMDHVAVIDFDGFITLTTQLGGVTVDNPHASRSRGYTFPKGKITIKGDEALAFVRERYDLPNGDLDRAGRQRLVVQAIIKKVLSADVLTDPAEFTSVVGVMADNLTVDDDLSDSEIRKIALSARLGADDVKLLQAPIKGFATVRGQSVDVVDEDALADLGRALHDDTMASYVRDHPEN